MERGALREVIQGLVRPDLGREEEVPTGRGDRLRHRLAREQVVAEVDRPQIHQALGVGGQPALGGIAFAVLSAISTRPPSRWKARSPPCRRSLSRVWSKAGCRCEGCTGSSMARIWLSVGTAVMPNRLWQFDIFRPSCSARWWARNDPLCMKNSEKPDRPISAML